MQGLICITINPFSIKGFRNLGLLQSVLHACIESFNMFILCNGQLVNGTVLVNCKLEYSKGVTVWLYGCHVKCLSTVISLSRYVTRNMSYKHCLGIKVLKRFLGFIRFY